MKEDIEDIREKMVTLTDLPTCVSDQVDKCIEEDMKLAIEFMEKSAARIEELMDWKASVEAKENVKWKAVANFIENNIYILIKTHGANVCREDIEGLAILRNEPIPSTEGLDREQLKALFLKQMKTKAF